MKKGFTLLETTIYIALTSLILTSLMTVSYQIMEGAGKTQKSIIALEEGDFLKHKIEWILNSTSQIIAPEIGTSSKDIKLYGDNPNELVQLDQIGNDLTLRIGDEEQRILNSSAVRVSNLNFNHYSGSSSEDILEVNFLVDGFGFKIKKHF